MERTRRAILISAKPLAHDHLRTHLATLPGLVVVAVAAARAEAIAALRAHRPDLVVLLPDDLPDGGLDLARAIRQRFPSVTLLVVTRRTDLDVIAAHARLGVAAYVLEKNLADLAEHIAAVEGGGAALDGSLADDLVELLGTPLGQSALPPALRQSIRHSASGPSRHPSRVGSGPRRQSILHLAGQGYSNKEIARILGIAATTVAEHLKRHRAKFGRVPRALLARM